MEINFYSMSDLLLVLLSIKAHHVESESKYNFTLQNMIQGVSHWNVSFKMALSDRNIQVRFCLKVSVYSWG